MKTRTVLVKMTTLIRMEVPEWNAQAHIDFWLNDSTHCAANEFKALAEAVEDGETCGCWCTKFEYQRDATDTDKENELGIPINLFKEEGIAQNGAR